MARTLVKCQVTFLNVLDATMKALGEMGYSVETSGQITAKKAGGKTVSIDMESLSSEETKVTIRVGFYGDDRESNVLKEKIEQMLFK